MNIYFRYRYLWSHGSELISKDTHIPESIENWKATGRNLVRIDQSNNWLYLVSTPDKISHNSKYFILSSNKYLNASTQWATRAYPNHKHNKSQIFECRWPALAPLAFREWHWACGSENESYIWTYSYSYISDRPLSTMGSVPAPHNSCGLTWFPRKSTCYIRYLSKIHHPQISDMTFKLSYI